MDKASTGRAYSKQRTSLHAALFLRQRPMRPKLGRAGACNRCNNIPYQGSLSHLIYEQAKHILHTPSKARSIPGSGVYRDNSASSILQESRIQPTRNDRHLKDEEPINITRWSMPPRRRPVCTTPSHAVCRSAVAYPSLKIQLPCVIGCTESWHCRSCCNVTSARTLQPPRMAREPDLQHIGVLLLDELLALLLSLCDARVDYRIDKWSLVGTSCCPIRGARRGWHSLPLVRYLQAISTVQKVCI